MEYYLPMPRNSNAIFTGTMGQFILGVKRFAISFHDLLDLHSVSFAVITRKQPTTINVMYFISTPLFLLFVND